MPAALVFGLLLPVFFVVHTTAAATITVNSTADDQNNDGECTLREAIVAANTDVASGAAGGECAAGSGTGDTIEFNIAGAGPHSIAIGSSLPTITDDGLTINGYSETGAVANSAVSPAPLNGTLMIEIDGTATTIGTGHCIQIAADTVAIRGLVINNCGKDGITMFGSNFVTIQGNYIGTDVTGLVDEGNGRDYVISSIAEGIFASASNNLTIGGTDPEDRNIIAGNQAGDIFIGNETDNANPSENNIIQGNYIGVGADGTTPLPSGYSFGLGNAILLGNSHDDVIGGSATGAMNVIGSSYEYGVGFRDGCTGTLIQGNYIGTDYTGNAGLSWAEGEGHISAGVHIGTVSSIFTREPNNITIGGDGAGEGNVISGNSYSGGGSAPGVQIDDDAYDNTVQGNIIGLGADGSTVLGNEGGGVVLGQIGSTTTNGNLVGGTTAGARNVISGNDSYGVRIGDADQNTVTGNYIGVASNGTTAKPNADDTIHIDGTSTENIIGGDAANEANIVANSTSGSGIVVDDTANDNALLRNSIVDNNALPIDLDNNGTTANDAGDADSGPNDLLNKPLWTSLEESAGNTTVDYTLDVPAGSYRVEFYSDIGESFLEAQSIISTGSGAQSFSNEVSGTGLVGVRLTATEIDVGTPSGFGATSEMGGAAANATALMVVNSTADDQDDDGECTLREAIVAANTGVASGNMSGECAEGAGTNTIEFDITSNEGAGPHTIQPTSALPTVQVPTTIDGYTETGASENTANTSSAFNGTIMVEIDMQNASDDDMGLTTQSDDVTVRGLAINRAKAEGDGIFISSGDNVTIAGNFIGLGTDGTTDYGNTDDGIVVASGVTNATVGGSIASARNVISGNGGAGIRVEANGAAVLGNFVGVASSGASAVPNVGQGILVVPGTSSNVIGGTTASSRNVISGNTGDGASVSGSSHTLRGNYFGLSANGLVHLANCDTINTGGLSVQGNTVTIGGTANGAENYFTPCSNGGNNLAVRFLGGFGVPNGGHTMQGNYVGVDINGDPVDTPATAGIGLVADTSNNLIGGSSKNAGNLIRGNGTGVIALELEPLTPPENNSIIGNSIYENTGGAMSGLGIDLLESPDFGSSLVEEDITPNEPGDADTGPNDYLNFPVIDSTTAGTGTLDVQFDLDVDESAPNGYRVEFFANSTGDASGNGEGEIYLGFHNVDGDVTDEVATLTVPPGVSAGSYDITATTTERDNSDDGFGATSEFAENLDNQSVPASSDFDGDGVPDAVENAGPNGGDANDDGTPDAEQGSVATILDAENDDYITLELDPAGECTQIDDFSSLLEEDLPEEDPAYSYPLTLTEFTIPCDDSVDGTIYWHGQEDFSSHTYRKYGPTTPGDTGTSAWYNASSASFSEGQTVIDGEDVATASFSLTDGALGDDTGDDGEIIDANGPGYPVETTEESEDEGGLAGVLADTGSNPLTYVAGGVLLIMLGLYIARRNSPKTFSIHQ